MVDVQDKIKKSRGILIKHFGRPSGPGLEGIGTGTRSGPCSRDTSGQLFIYLSLARHRHYAAHFYCFCRQLMLSGFGSAALSNTDRASQPKCPNCNTPQYSRGRPWFPLRNCHDWGAFPRELFLVIKVRCVSKSTGTGYCALGHSYRIAYARDGSASQPIVPELACRSSNGRAS